MDRLLLLLIFLPMLAAAPIYALGKRHLSRAFGLTVTIGAAQVILCVLIALAPATLRMDDPYGLGLGLHARSDDFRALYAGVASFMWLMTGMMLPQYMAHGHRQPTNRSEGLLDPAVAFELPQKTKARLDRIYSPVMLARAA